MGEQQTMPLGGPGETALTKVRTRRTLHGKEARTIHPVSSRECFCSIHGVGLTGHRVFDSQRRLFQVRKLSTLRSPPPQQTSRCVQSARKAAAEQRAEDEKRQFQQLIAMYRASGTTFRETKASVRKAEETRLKIEQDLEVRVFIT